MQLCLFSIISIGTIMIVEQLGSMFFGVMILLKKAWSVQVSRVLYIVNAVLYFIGGNIISGIISIYLAIKLNGMISKRRAARNIADVPPRKPREPPRSPTIKQFGRAKAADMSIR